MSAKFFRKLVRRSAYTHARIPRHVSVQEPRSGRWAAIATNLTKVCAELTKPCMNDNKAARMDTHTSVLDCNPTSIQCYSKAGVEYVQVKTLSNIPTFVGVDAINYNLQKDDVVFIPHANALVLIIRGLVVLATQVIESTSGDESHRSYQEDAAPAISDAY